MGNNVFGQDSSSTKKRPALNAAQFRGLIASPMSPKHLVFNKLSASTNAAMKSAASSQPITIRSIPTFTSSFTFQNQIFPFTMAGHAPQNGGTTRIDTSYLAISFVFDEFLDQNGNNVFIDATANTKTLLNGPDFQRFPFATGNTQFSDAVQRAEFFKVMKKDGDGDADDRSWHTLLEAPRQFKPITVEVPVGSSLVGQAPDGTFFAAVDMGFMISQLNTLVQTEDLRIDEIPIFVTHNAVFVDLVNGQIVNCCTGGFHTAFETQQVGNTVFVQVFDFATSFDAADADALFGDPTVFADVDPLSHEITETFNDPFGNNIVPSWIFPGVQPVTCSNVLETGDPVENVANPTFPITLNGFLYHPQTEALLQWFSRENPSSAFEGAFSFPGNNFTTPSTACPVGP
jgi:hypothetical protein